MVNESRGFNEISPIVATRAQHRLKSLIQHAFNLAAGLARGPARRAQALDLITSRRAPRPPIAKSRFVAQMSHELRTRLNTILEFSEVMQTSCSARMGSWPTRIVAATFTPHT
jgi:signal transduction histidine kinase